MCGIAGVYFFRQQEVPKDLLGQFTRLLSHRGPEESGTFSDRNAGLAHTRLKIIDLSAAASQPMKDESSQYVLVFNGEIYNFRELRRELASEFNFFSNSDTEVILRLFQKRREHTWEALNGMFAAAILDTHSQELFLTRDHAGVKPLYFSADSDKFIFASEPKAILPFISQDVDQDSLAAYLSLGYFPDDRTPYKHIRKLRPGYFMRVHRLGIEHHPYWTIRDFQPQKPLEDPVFHLEHLLRSSVGHQMISDVPVGAFLSGGIDSSLIVALMTHLGAGPIRTFTAGFQNMGYYDERPIAAEVAKLFRTEHHEFVVEQKVEEIVEKMADVFDEPFADSSAIPTFCLAELTKKHVTVALSGTGGDEIFGGYRKYMAAHWSTVYGSLPKGVRRSIQKAAALLPASRKTLWQERALLLQRFTAIQPGSSLQLNSIFAEEEIKELMGFSGEINFRPREATVVENMMLFDFENYLPEDLLIKEDRCTMAFGLEARVPYLDRPVVEFMASLPVRYKVSGTSTKKLFKKVASKYLPASIVMRPKHGFGSPAAEWFRNEIKTMAMDVLLEPRSFLSSKIVESKLQEHLQNQADHSRALWALLMLELWHRKGQF